MDPLFFLFTVVLIGVFVFPLLRLISIKCRMIPDGEPCGNPVPKPGQLIAASEPDTTSAGYRPANRSWGVSSALSAFIGIAFLYSITSGYLTVDTLYTPANSDHPITPSASAEHAGTNWKIVDGIRWFHVTGTDSAGIGYSGWISELFFRASPPESTSGTTDIMEKIGLPSMRERIEGARRLREIGTDLQKALSRD